jgi:type III secretory pathway lipoprotein EscJ
MTARGERDERHDEGQDDEVELCRVSGKFEAEPVVAALRANGIAARTRGEAAGELYGLTLDGMGEVTILVRQSQVAEARDLLKAADLGELRLGDEPADETRK